MPQDDNPFAFDWQRDHRDRLLHLLPVHPGAMFSTGPLAAGLEIHRAEAALGLGTVRDEGLIAQLPDGRWQRPDGPRDDAALLPDPDVDVGRYVAQHAMFHWYVRHTAEVDKILDPTSHRSSWVFAPVDPETITFTDTTTALMWFETELTNILAVFRLAVTRGWDPLIIGLAEALWNALWVTGRAAELADTQRLGALAAARLDDALEPIFLARQGLGLSDCGDHEAALVACTAAVGRADTLDDPRAQATALSARASANIGVGNLDAAQRDLYLAREIDERRGSRRGMALRNRDLGALALHEKVNKPPLAEHYLSIASVLFRLLGDEVDYGRCRILLADARLRQGRAATALTALYGVEGTLRAHGVRRYLAALTTVLAKIHRELGDTARADAYLVRRPRSRRRERSRQGHGGRWKRHRPAPAGPDRPTSRVTALRPPPFLSSTDDPTTRRIPGSFMTTEPARSTRWHDAMTTSPRLDYLGYVLVGLFLDRPWLMETVRRRLRPGRHRQNRTESLRRRAIRTQTGRRETTDVADVADGDNSDWRPGS